jgi:hypothetical protein
MISVSFRGAEMLTGVNASAFDRANARGSRRRVPEGSKED